MDKKPCSIPYLGLAILLAALLCAGCGQKGPLYLPEPAGPGTSPER